MLRSLLLLCALMLIASVASRPAQAGPPDLEHERLRLVWRPASVIWPLEPIAELADASNHRRLEQRAALLAGELPAPSIRGVVELDRERAVGVWIAALETVRVRQLSGSAQLRFVRGVDGNAAVIEPGLAVAPGPGGELRWELHQPPGEGTIWSIEADEPTRVLIERVEPREPRFVDVEVETEILEWIEARDPDTDIAALLEPSGDVRGQLLLHAALARELLALGDGELDGKAAARLADAVRAWRMLAAMVSLDRDRPAVRPYFARDRARSGPISLADTELTRLAVDQSRDYRLARGPSRWVIDRKGPGQLRIAARTWAPLGQPLASAQLRIHVGGRVIARVALSSRPAQHGDRAAALPRFEPLTTVAGEPVGELAELNLVLGPEHRDYEIELVGGPALLSIEGARRIAGTAAAIHGWTPGGRTRALERALRRDRSVAHEWLALLLVEQSHAPPPISIDDPRFEIVADQSPLLTAVGLAIVAGDPQLERAAFTAAVARVRSLLAVLDRDPTLAPAARGLVRARWLELLALHDRPDLALGLVARTDPSVDPIAELPVEGLRVLAELLGPTRVTGRSFALALLELARMRAPADVSLREQYLRAWTAATRWSRRRPVPEDGERVRPIGEWLIRRETALSDPDERRGVWVRLEPGVPVRVLAELGETSPSDTRMRLFDLHVATPLGEREPVRLRVDQRSWWSPLLSVVQHHRFAVAPGVHELELSGPPQTVAWVELPPADPTAAIAESVSLGRREVMWSLPDSRWRIPGPAVPGFVRLELRWPEDLPPRSVRITVREDGDSARTILVDPRAGLTVPIDREALPIHTTGWASDRHDVILPIAATTTMMHFEVEDELPIAASLSLRRALLPDDLAEPTSSTPMQAEPEFVGLTTLDRAGLLAELARASRTLLATPDELETRARRAALLVLLGETGFARADMDRLAEGSSERAAALLTELEQRIHALIDPREIVVAELGRPELIEPALSGFIEDDRAAIEPWLDVWASARAAEPAQALALVEAELTRSDSLLGELSRAQLLARQPLLAREASRAWLNLYGRMRGSVGLAREPIAVGLAAIGPLLAHLEDPDSDARDAGLAYGLAREFEPVYGHTSIRRLGVVAAQRSDWTRLDHSEDNAGFERLELPVADLRPTPGAEIRDALLVAPWPSAEAEQLRPGHLGVLVWDATPGSGSSSVKLWCRSLRPDRRESELARLRVRLLGESPRSLELERELELRDAELGELELPIERRGRHRLEVVLGDDPGWTCSWSSEQLIDSRRRAQWWTSEPQRGVELIVLGPATLAIEARAIVDPDRQPQTLIAAIEPLDHAQRLQRGELALAGEVERSIITENLRRFDVGHTGAHVLLLTEPGPHRIRLTTDRGRALIRAQLRRDRGDIAPPTPLVARRPEPPERDDLSDDLGWRSAGASLSIVAHDPRPSSARRFGTLDLRLNAGLDEIGDLDDLRPRPGLVARASWRRELVEHLLWLMIGAETRLRDQSAPAGGGLLHLRANIPRTGLRTGVDFEGLAQAFAGQVASSVRVYGFLDRPTWLSPHLVLRPGLRAGLRWQSLDPAQVGAAAGALEPNPRIYTRYIHDHPILLRPELELRAYPFRDLAIWTEAQLVPNSDLRSLDHLNLEIGLEGLARRARPWVPTWGLGYQASPRFADAHRSTFFVRHRVDARVGVAVWARDIARIAVGASHQVFISTVAPIRNVFELWIRVDASFGRRMRDHGPGEQWFREPWAPRAWADEDQQARSTQAPY